MNFFSVFIIVVGILMSVAWYLGDTPQFFERTILESNTLFSDEEESEHTYKVSPHVSVFLANINGPITFIGHEKNEIKILTTKKGNKNHFKNVSSEIHVDDEFVSIKTLYSKRYNHTAVSVVYQVFVPHNALLKLISNINGSITIDHVHNHIHTKNVNGLTTINGSQNSVAAETVNGTIHISVDALKKDQTISLSSTNGTIECFIPETLAASIDAKALVGTVVSDFKFSHYEKKLTGIHATGTRGNNEGGTITINVINGRIHLHKSLS
ncbi:hypothetical protein K9K77_00145 [Candidatus Babeliales bacterium]|nr:hypothetical protein [Candidatus Babeliales bacterium]